jgi:hypothetical protein
LIAGSLAGPAAAAPPKQILFPVVGPTKYTNDFGAPRGSRRHQGNDLMSARRTPVVAVEAGRVRIWRQSASAGCMLYLYGASGTTYMYIHLNNDETLRDDNRARDCRLGVAYAPNLRNDQRVKAGQLLGFVGNSGADGVAPHLHFELHPNGGRAVSPYKWLRAAPKLLYTVRGGITAVRVGIQGVLKAVSEETVDVGVRNVFLSAGRGSSWNERRIRVAFEPELVVERKLKNGTMKAATLESAKLGERVTVWTSSIKPTLASRLAGPRAIAAAKIRLRGTDG